MNLHWKAGFHPNPASPPTLRPQSNVFLILWMILFLFKKLGFICSNQCRIYYSFPTNSARKRWVGSWPSAGPKISTPNACGPPSYCSMLINRKRTLINPNFKLYVYQYLFSTGLSATQFQTQRKLSNQDIRTFSI